jgi:L-rhamnose isomerase/sugar isomerase
MQGNGHSVDSNPSRIALSPDQVSESARARVRNALDGLAIELPSWGFANTGTRFGKFSQSSAATTLAEKFADAGEVRRLTGSVASVALHVLWDLPQGAANVAQVQALEVEHGIRAGSINPNLFQDQAYKFGSLCNPDPGIRRLAIDHTLASVELARQLGSRDISVWLADGSSYPGTQSITRRMGWLDAALREAHAALGPEQRLLIEYKPFEPYFYHTDLADWGMALEMARRAGPQARVLVDLGHHYQAQNVEQVVAWLLSLGMLGGFHFNDRRYADDDLTLGSIDPYQVFRIFHQTLVQPEADLAYMIDQSHNMKGKMEAAVQTVVTAQELYARAALVDLEQLAVLQDSCRLVEAEELFRGAFWTDVRPLVRAWRAERGFAEEPLVALRCSGYVEKTAAVRGPSNAAAALQGSYA